MGTGVTTSERDELAAKVRAGFFGSAEEVEIAQRALAVLLSALDQAEAAIQRFEAKYGEQVVDPLTELRMKLQRGG